MPKIELTIEGLRRVRSPSIPYDTLEIDLKEGIRFIDRGITIGTVGGAIEGEVITITGLFGRVEVQT